MTAVLQKSVAPFAVKGVDDGARTFTGLASTWDLDLGGDVVHKGAYAKTLDAWRASKGRRVIPLIDQHRYGSTFDVVGKLVDAAETDDGLVTTFEVVPGQDGEGMLARIKGGFINSLSIGYEVAGKPEVEQTEVNGVKRAIRHLREVKLHEVSAVIWPMNPGATIDAASVKALLATLSDEDRQKVLADAGPPAPPAYPADLAEKLRHDILAVTIRHVLSRAPRPTSAPAT